MRVLVCGGRYFADYLKLNWELSKLHANLHFTELLHSDAPGADQLAAKWARTVGIGVIRAFPADWKRYGRAAGSKRNEQMLREGAPALVVAFPGKTGTEHMKRIARSAGVKVIEVSEDGLITGK